jgi:hypothetical protein
VSDSRSDSAAVGEVVCRDCGAGLTPAQAYCGTCGQKRIVGKITLHEIAHDLIHAFVHVDRSVLSLVRQLLLRPGAVARDFIEGRRRRYFGPFGFLAPSPELSRHLFYALPVWPAYFAFACSQFLPGRRWIAALKGIAAIALAYAALLASTTAIAWVFARTN